MDIPLRGTGLRVDQAAIRDKLEIIGRSLGDELLRELALMAQTVILNPDDEIRQGLRFSKSLAASVAGRSEKGTGRKMSATKHEYDGGDEPQAWIVSSFIDKEEQRLREAYDRFLVVNGSEMLDSSDVTRLVEMIEEVCYHEGLDYPDELTPIEILMWVRDQAYVHPGMPTRDQLRLTGSRDVTLEREEKLQASQEKWEWGDITRIPALHKTRQEADDEADGRDTDISLMGFGVTGEQVGEPEVVQRYLGVLAPHVPIVWVPASSGTLTHYFGRPNSLNKQVEVDGCIVDMPAKWTNRYPILGKAAHEGYFEPKRTVVDMDEPKCGCESCREERTPVRTYARCAIRGIATVRPDGTLIEREKRKGQWVTKSKGYPVKSGTIKKLKDGFLENLDRKLHGLPLSWPDQVIGLARSKHGVPLRIVRHTGKRVEGASVEARYYHCYACGDSPHVLDTCDKTDVMARYQKAVTKALRDSLTGAPKGSPDRLAAESRVHRMAKAFVKYPISGWSGNWRCLECGGHAMTDGVLMTYKSKLSSRDDAVTWVVQFEVWGHAFMRMFSLRAPTSYALAAGCRRR